MGETARTPKNSPQPTPKPRAAVELTAAEAARAARIAEADVFAWALRGDRLTVVTVAGQKIEVSL